MSDGSLASVTPPPLTKQLHAVALDIKLSHTVFALPFALLGAALATAWADRLPAGVEIVLVLACMVTARTAAMCMNRLADAPLDAVNPRTAGRAVPSGRVTARTMLIMLIASSAAFLACATGFLIFRGNVWPPVLAPVVLAWLLGYSLTKRFTWLCHAYLGAALAISPVAAALALEPGYVAQPYVWLLAGMVTCWVAGFDILYALQDLEVDRRDGLHALPARWGVTPALWTSRLLHVGAALCVVLLAVAEPRLEWLFTIGVMLTVLLLNVEHAVVLRRGAAGIPVAFLTVNGIISVLLGTLGIIDAYVG